VLPTREQVEQIAPDGRSVAAALKVARPSKWADLGRDGRALWGKCAGSRTYDVRVDLTDLASKCSCPSRKFPCKHALALLILLADDPTAAPEGGEPPGWVADWIAGRDARSAGKAAREAARDEGFSDEEKAERQAKRDAARDKRARKREDSVRAGLAALDLWLRDLVRGGLGAVEGEGDAFWEHRAAELVNAQAAGLGRRLKALAEVPGTSEDWPVRLLLALGRIALLIDAYGRQDELPEELRGELRAAIGWNQRKEDVAESGERVVDRWLVVGQSLEVEDRLTVRRSWLVGLSSRRPALVLEYRVGNQAWAERLAPGLVVDATAVFWPSAGPLRALLADRTGSAPVLDGPWPGVKGIDGFLQQVAQTVAAVPWRILFPCLLTAVTPVLDDGRWWVRDAGGAGLPLVEGEHWRLLAVSGGRPVGLAGEWNGDRLRPLSVHGDGGFVSLEVTP